ncbi:MAG: tRNA pseudouridine(13) synthase TruD, partial [bacterium]
MKIKSLATDFIVKEYINIQNDIIDKNDLKNHKSIYLIYKITKENISTLKIADIFLKNNIKIGFIGLKDKYSLSTQYLSFLLPNLNQIFTFNKKIESIFKKIKNIKNYEFITYLNRPLRKQDLIYNEFNITLRDIDKKELKNYIQKLELFKNFYFLNFYDDQRFPIK